MHYGAAVGPTLALILAACATAPAPVPTGGAAAPGTTAVDSAAPLPSASDSAASLGTGPAVVQIGEMSSPRAAHSATLLRDGTVLIAGGCVEDSCEGTTVSAELLDPATGKTSPTGSMTTPRVGHDSVSLPDGRVLLVGGWGTSAVNSTTELYDPAKRTFAAGPALDRPRTGPVTVFLPNGTLLIAGGYDGRDRLRTALLLDPPTGTVKETGAMTAARASHVGVALADGRVLVAGGSVDGKVLASAEIYDPSAGTWSATGDMTTRRHKHAAVALDDGRVLIVGGSDERDGRGVYASAELFDPATGTFTATADMTAPRYKLDDAVVRLPDGRVLVAGGGRQADVFDPATGTFTAVPGTIGESYSFAGAVALGDAVLVTGGYDASIDVTAGVWRYGDAAPVALVRD